MMRVFARRVRTLLRGDFDILAEQDLEALVRAIADEHSRRSGVAITMSGLASAIEAARRLLERS